MSVVLRILIALLAIVDLALAALGGWLVYVSVRAYREEAR